MTIRPLHVAAGEESVYSEESTAIAEGHDSSKRLNREARSEIGRVAQRIFFTKPDETGKTILLCGTDDSRHRSAWIALHMGQFLAAQGRNARVLCIGDHRPERIPAGAVRRGPADAPPGRCTVEWLAEGFQDTDLTHVIVARLREARQAGESTVVHLENLNRFPELLSCAEQFDGAALIVRASHTRKAALSAAREQLAAADLPLMGGILIEQTFPVPERFYRVL